LVLLVSAGLMIRTFEALRTVEPGFTGPAQLQTMVIAIPALLAPQPEQVTRMQHDIADKLTMLPGVRAVGFASAVPLDGSAPNWDIVVPEGSTAPPEQMPLRYFVNVSPGYFRAAGTRLLAGRDLTWSDIYRQRPYVLVSENLARELWGSPGGALGKRFREPREVIGVVQDVRQNGLQEKAPPTVYWPILTANQYGPAPLSATRMVTYMMRSPRTGTEGFVEQVRRAVWSVNASLPVASVRTMQDISDQSMARTSFTLVMLGIAGTMALVLGIVGIYGVISYTVSQRRREIGIRLALGAELGALRRMFVGQGVKLAAIGVVIGLAGAAGLMQLMKSLLFGISPLDPVTYAAVPLLLAAAAALASYLPARRAASVDPAEALRAE